MRQAGSARHRKKLLVAIVATLLSLGLGEIALTLLGPGLHVRREMAEKQAPYIADHSPYLPITLPAGIAYRHQYVEFDVVYRTNDLGYRGPYPRTIGKAEGTKRILLLGDSFTFGWGIDWAGSYSGLLAQALEPRGYEVINAGFKAGYSPDSYYAFLQREGFALEPDIVVIFIYTGNDIEDLRNSIWLDTDERGAPRSVDTTRFFTDYDGHVIKMRHDEMPWYYTVPLLSQSHVFIAFARVMRALSEPSWEEAKSRLETSIRAINAVSDERDIPVLYFAIKPGPNFPPLLGADRDEVHQITMKLLNRSHPEVYDLAGLATPDCYFNGDGHFNRKGHQSTFLRVMEVLDAKYLPGPD